jgi:hypothetical protein
MMFEAPFASLLPENEKNGKHIARHGRRDEIFFFGYHFSSGFS